MIRSSVCALALLIVSSTTVLSQIYVAPNGSDANPGTIEQSLESMQKAQELASPGDTVYIRGGKSVCLRDLLGQERNRRSNDQVLSVSWRKSCF
jgi:hypothetical protein